MSQAPALDLVLLWHMHQPDYRDAVDGRFMLPWVYLHAIKDYADMAAHHERHPGIRAVFNFVPVLLEQIEDYVAQFESGELRDPLLALLRVEDLDGVGAQDRALVLESCFHSSHETMLQPYPQYRRLLELYRATGEDPVAATLYLSGGYLADLLTWYHLAWIGEADRRADPLFGRLMAQGAGFSHAQRLELFEAIGRIVAGLIPRYRALAATGRIELSTTPRTHPIGPLLLDFAAARDTLPQAELPRAPAYPGGAARLEWQLAQAIASHAQRFGGPPAGLWPSEGAVSAPFIAACGAAGLTWAASSESVLANSLGSEGRDAQPDRAWLYRAWKVPGAPGVTMVFRDERLSDQIGFEYSKWHGRDAAAHLLGELEAIARRAPAGETPLVLIAMDGENAWEYFPYNGFYFFEELYSALARHPFIRTRTMSEAVGAFDGRAGTLPRLAAGSWVLGTLSTWIGEPAKNAAWDLLCEAKQAYDETLAAGAADARTRALLERQLAACEGSDWFWWLGSHNPQAAVERFDTLFRHNLGRLYELMGREPPGALAHPLAVGGGHAEAGGTMRRATG